jgi:ABC-type polysaccharide/polyol phosphate export permease
MKFSKVIAALCLSAMTIILFYAFMSGNFTEEGVRLLRMPWGIVSLVDLYAGFTLFSCWIAYRLGDPN